MNGVLVGPAVPVEPVTMTDMQDGQLAVILGVAGHIGDVVQFIAKGYSVEQDMWICLGRQNGQSWSGSPKVEVRILTPGETLVVQ